MSRNVLRWVLLFGFIALPMTVFSVDNPDAPDYVAEFTSAANQYEQRIQNEATKTQEVIAAYAEYETFLDQELNRAYKLLKQQLSEEEASALLASQRNWLKYRDAEFEFYKVNWTKPKFGSSVYLSKGAFRTALVRDRVETLYGYLKSY